MGSTSLCPKFLEQGSVVRLVAPAGAYDEPALHSGIRLLRQAGLVPKVTLGGPQDCYYAADATGRADALMAALDDPEAAALWAIRGGSGTAQLMPRAQRALADRLGRAPLWLIGFSDITTLHGVWRQHGVLSVHGPNVVNLPMWGEAAQNELFMLLEGKVRGVRFAESAWLIPPATPWDVSGPIVGGNLTVLASLAGTGLLPDARGSIVFLEDIDERPYKLHRCLHQLVAAGTLTGIKAVVIGQLTRCVGQDHNQQQYQAIELLLPTLAALGVPVAVGLPVGHEPSSRALPLGAMAILNGRSGLLDVQL